jgi:hypothetical protein
MKRIPTALRKEIANDPWYKKCCVCNNTQVLWHHNLIFSGSQVNHVFCILPVCETHHEGTEGLKKNAMTRYLLNEIMYMRASEEEKKKYGLKKPVKPASKTKYKKCDKCGAENTLMVCCGKIK